jgi:hypothetical protein
MTRRRGDPSTGTLTAFRVALTCLAVVTTLGFIGSWQALDHAASLFSTEPRVSPFWVVGLVGVCVAQVALLWWTRVHLSWWEPVLVEAGLCVLFAIVSHQIVGTHETSCSSAPPGPQICMTIQPAIIHGAWLGVFAVVGGGLGVLWSFSARQSRVTDAASP